MQEGRVSMDNTVTVSGTLGKDLDLRYTASGRAVASVGVAVNRRFQVNNEWTEETSWFQLVMWADLAEHAAASLSKGDRVIASGRLQQRSYDKDGEKRSITEIVVDDIGPSLKWAECSVERVQRTESSGSGGNRGAAEPLGEEEPFVRDAREGEL
jgi:single-strand DNA-binding protein